MNVRNCKKCGKLFNYISGMPICPECRDLAEQQFQNVKKFIREHPNADMKEVAETCSVETGQIQQWIREERLEFTDDSPIKLPCEGCGKMINSGKFCDACKNTMAKNLSNAIDKPKPVEAPKPKEQKHENKMRFLDRH